MISPENKPIAPENKISPTELELESEQSKNESDDNQEQDEFYHNPNEVIEHLESDDSKTIDQKIQIAQESQREIEDKIKLLEQQINEDTEKLKTIRDSLGLNESGQNENQEQEQKKLVKLQSQLETIDDLRIKLTGQREKQDAGNESEQFIKQDIIKLEDNLNELSFILKKREDEGFDQLIYDDKSVLIRSATSYLAESVDRDKIDFNAVDLAINNLKTMAEEFGKLRLNETRDDPESLNQLYFSVGRIFETLRELNTKIGQMEDEKAKEISNHLIKAIDEIDEAGRILNWKRNALNSYLR